MLYIASAEALVRQAAVELGRPELRGLLADPSRPLPPAEAWRLLPAQGRGYYREYTVKTQGARDRGARRIVCGGSQPTRPDRCYYSGDHYASFARIVQ